MIAEGYVPPEEIREHRTLARGRERLVEKRTDFKNEVHAILDHHGVEYSLYPFSEKGREILAGENLSVGLIGQSLIEPSLTVIDALPIQIGAIKERTMHSIANTSSTATATMPSTKYTSTSR